MTIQEVRKFFDEWSCGCGDPEAVVVLVRDVLAAIQQRWDTAEREVAWKEQEAAFKQLLPTGGVYYFVLYLLTHWDVLEHGGSVGGSWLTGKGRELLAALREHTPEDVAKSCCVDGYADDEECPYCSGLIGA